MGEKVTGEVKKGSRVSNINCNCKNLTPPLAPLSMRGSTTILSGLKLYFPKWEIFYPIKLIN
ncbi:MAG: hypothetical protein IPN87_18050 [Saprospiraceae bacterium]|nr:hypothetical protein [Candidatus Brachybacter algidus]